jgi:hypothetical protein
MASENVTVELSQDRRLTVRVARLLRDNEIQEHSDFVSDAEKHLASFKDVIQGKTSSPAIPDAPN